MFYLHKNLLLLPNPIALIQLNGSLTLVPLHTSVLIDLGSLPIRSLILHIPFTSVINESFMLLVRAKLKSPFIMLLTTDAPLSIMFSTALKLDRTYYLSPILSKLVPKSNSLRTSVRSSIPMMSLSALPIFLMVCSDCHAPS